jgi:mRNA interferase RelE/StbE
LYKVLLQPKAAKELQKIDQKNQERIRQALNELTVNPYKAGEQLHPAHYYKVKAGDYRAVYKINKEQQQIIVLLVDHRKNVYDDFASLLY